tara:strand:- start:326 stop:709 length:384 start_codon:yes stop_codon:yes gene_type:complete
MSEKKIKISKETRKRQQKKPKRTSFKGKEIEFDTTIVNPITESFEYDTRYEPGKGKSYSPKETSAQRASDKRFKSFASIDRKIDTDNVKPKREFKGVAKRAGGGKLKSKFFTGGTVNPSFGTDFDDR